MKRILLMVLRLFYFAPIAVWKIGRYGKQEGKYEEAYEYIKMATRKATHAGRVDIEAYGLENLPEEDGFVFFPNHQGMFDVLVFLQTCPRPFAFVMKKEASNIILLKQVSQALGSYAMDRADIKQSLQVINHVAEDVKNGKNFLIFPEGTRSKDGNMIPFKEGSMKMASKTGCPIIPIAITNSAQIWEAHLPYIRPAHVIVEYGAPIYPKELSKEDQKFLGSYAQHKIQEMLDQHKQED